MTRLILLIIMGFLAALYIPESRAALLKIGGPAVTPVLRWQTEHEMGDIVREIRLYERERYGRLPPTRGFANWLGTRFSEDVTTDSWGVPYAFFVARDSFTVVSWGPDGLPRNEDDIHVPLVRTRPGR